MQAASVQTAADARKIVAARTAEHVKVGLFDIDGVLRGKYMQRDKFTAALDGGFGFCGVVLGWDVADGTYDNAAFTGWHTGFPDAAVRLLPETCRGRSVRGRHAVVPRRVRRRRRGDLSAGDAAPRARPRRCHGLPRRGRVRVRVLRLRGDAPLGARAALCRSQADGAGLVRLFGAANVDGGTVLPRAARHGGRHAFSPGSAA